MHGFDPRDFESVSNVTARVSGYQAKHRIRVGETDSVKWVKDRVSEQWKIPVEHQLLSLQHVQLEGEVTEGEYMRDGLWGEYCFDDCELVITDMSWFDYHRSAQSKRDGYVQIRDTSLRGITLKQLRILESFIKNNCGDEDCSGWYDMSIHSPTYKKLITSDACTLYHTMDWVIKPVTRAAQCSFVEFIAASAHLQVPKWFVSHWWGEQVLKFVSCLEEHCCTRELNVDADAYWVCAYANNQHGLVEEIPRDPRETSFFKAMSACRGVLLVLDGTGVAFNRVWCCFELATALNTRTSFLDITTAAPWVFKHRAHGRVMSEERHGACVITESLTEWERREDAEHRGRGQMLKAERESAFPIALIRKGLEIEIGRSRATFECDRRRILNSIRGARTEELDEAPPLQHEAYRGVNARLRSMFALAGWYNAVKSHPQVLPLVGRTVREDVGRKVLILSFAACDSFDDARLEHVASCLPASLRELDLNMLFCRALGNDGVSVLAGLLRAPLRILRLNLSFCFGIGDESIAALFANMPITLKVLRLNLRGCKISDDSLSAMAAFLSKSTLRSLEVCFARCKGVTDEGVCSIVSALPDTLRTLELDVQGCAYVGDVSAETIAEEMENHVPSLRVLRTDLSSTAVSQKNRDKLRPWRRPEDNDPADLMDLGAEDSQAISAGGKLLREVLRRCEEGGDGHLTEEELVRTLGIACHDLSHEQMLSAFRAADTDRDGFVDYEEFCDVLNGYVD